MEATHFPIVDTGKPAPNRRGLVSAHPVYAQQLHHIHYNPTDWALVPRPTFFHEKVWPPQDLGWLMVEEEFKIPCVNCGREHWCSCSIFEWRKAYTMESVVATTYDYNEPRSLGKLQEQKKPGPLGQEESKVLQPQQMQEEPVKQENPPELNLYQILHGTAPSEIPQGLSNQIKPKLYIREMEGTGSALFTRSALPQDTYIGEITGILRPVDLDAGSSTENLDIIEAIVGPWAWALENPVVAVIDSFHAGGPMKYLNHSCDPNCKLVWGRVGCQRGLFVQTTKNIAALEELTVYHSSCREYKFQYCAAAKCSCHTFPRAVCSSPVVDSAVRANIQNLLN